MPNGETSFVEKLRMNNIFPTGGVPFGMPNLSAGQVDIGGATQRLLPMLLQEKEKDRQLQLELARMRQPKVEQIGQSMQQGPPNVVYKPDPNSAIDAQVREMLTPSIKSKELEFKQQQLQQKGELEGRKTDIAQQRADVYRFKAMNPGMKIITPKGGNVAAVNPITGETIDLGIDSGTLTEQEKIDLQGEKAMEQIGARGEETRKTQELRGSQALEQIGARISGQKEVEGMRQARPELPTQTRVRQETAARQLANTRPELAQFVTVAPDGSFQIQPPGQTDFFGRPTGPTLAQFAEIQKSIYGEPTKTTTPKTTTPAKKEETKTTPKTTTPKASKYSVTIE